MMADLLATQEGRDLLLKISCFLGSARSGKALSRNFYRAFDAWKTNGYFSLETLLSGLNPLAQDEIESLGNLLGSLGCAVASSQDMTIFVNAATGDDASGDGSENHPYETLNFFKNLPLVINNTIRILITGNPTVDNLDIHNIFGPNGSLSFIGVGAPVVVTTTAGAGPFEITVKTSYNIAARSLTVVDVFNVDELYGNFMRFEDGPQAGKVRSVNANDASEVWSPTSIGEPDVGDTFVMVTPAAGIKTNTVNITARGPRFSTDTNVGARINFFNLNLDVSEGGVNYRPVNIDSEVVVQMSFCRLMSATAQEHVADICSDLNRYSAIDTGAAALAETSIANLDQQSGTFNNTNPGLLFFNKTGLPTTNGPEIKISTKGTCEIMSLDCRGPAMLMGSFGRIENSALSKLFLENGATGIVLGVFLNGKTSTNCVVMNNSAYVKLNNSYLRQASDYFFLTTGNIELSTVEGGGAANCAGYGMEFHGMVRVMTQTDPTSLIGTTAAIYFAGGVGASAFPILNATVVDSLGSRVSYF